MLEAAEKDRSMGSSRNSEKRSNARTMRSDRSLSSRMPTKDGRSSRKTSNAVSTRKTPSSTHKIATMTVCGVKSRSPKLHEALLKLGSTIYERLCESREKGSRVPSPTPVKSRRDYARVLALFHEVDRLLNLEKSSQSVSAAVRGVMSRRDSRKSRS